MEVVNFVKFLPCGKREIVKILQPLPEIKMENNFLDKVQNRDADGLKKLVKETEQEVITNFISDILLLRCFREGCLKWRDSPHPGEYATCAVRDLVNNYCGVNLTTDEKSTIALAAVKKVNEKISQFNIYFLYKFGESNAALHNTPDREKELERLSSNRKRVLENLETSMKRLKDTSSATDARCIVESIKDNVDTFKDQRLYLVKDT